MQKNKEKGFTLVELLGIIVLVAILAIVVVASVDRSLKNGQQKAYDKQLKTIELAAKNYMSDNLDSLPDAGETIIVKLVALKMEGYIDVNISDPTTGKCFNNELEISVSKINNAYKYKIKEDTIRTSNDFCNLIIYNPDDDNDEGNEPGSNPENELEPIIYFSDYPEEVFTGSEYAISIYYNISNKDRDISGMTSLNDVQIPNEYYRYTLSSEEEVSTGFKRILYFNTYSTSSDIFSIKVLEGFVINSVGKKSAQAILDLEVREILNNDHDNDYDVVCDNECSLVGERCNTELLKNNEGIQCKVKGDGQNTFDLYFHVLDDDGEQLKLLLDYTIPIVKVNRNVFEYCENNSFKSIFDDLNGYFGSYDKISRFDYKLTIISIYGSTCDYELNEIKARLPEYTEIKKVMNNLSELPNWLLGNSDPYWINMNKHINTNAGECNPSFTPSESCTPTQFYYAINGSNHFLETPDDAYIRPVIEVQKNRVMIGNKAP